MSAGAAAGPGMAQLIQQLQAMQADNNNTARADAGLEGSGERRCDFRRCYLLNQVPNGALSRRKMRGRVARIFPPHCPHLDLPARAFSLMAAAFWAARAQKSRRRRSKSPLATAVASRESYTDLRQTIHYKK